jgi:hypothetical protein
MLEGEEPVVSQQRRVWVAEDGENAALVTGDMGTVQVGRPGAALEGTKVILRNERTRSRLLNRNFSALKKLTHGNGTEFRASQAFCKGLSGPISAAPDVGGGW